MHKLLISIALVAMAAASPAFAQATTNPSTSPSTPAPGTSSDTTTPGTTPTPPGLARSGTTTPDQSSAAGSSEATPAPTILSPPESIRLDPSAPSELRIQIDPGNTGDAVSNPDAQSSNPAAPGQTLNELEGSSSNGISTGTSGLGGTTPMPPTMFPSTNIYPGSTATGSSTYPRPITPPLSTPSFSSFGGRGRFGTPSGLSPSAGISSPSLSASPMLGSSMSGSHLSHFSGGHFSGSHR